MQIRKWEAKSDTKQSDSSLSGGRSLNTHDSPVVIISLKVVVKLERRTAAQDEEWRGQCRNPNPTDFQLLDGNL